MKTPIGLTVKLDAVSSKEEQNKRPGLIIPGNTSSSSVHSWRDDIARIVHHDEEEDNMKSDDFENIRKLGEGAAGTVWQVKYKPTQQIMAKKVFFFSPYYYYYLLIFTMIDNHSRTRSTATKTNIKRVVIFKNM